MTAGADLLRATADALPTTDPVGAIVAAAWQFDHETRDVVDRLVRIAATARGVPDDVIRLEVGLLRGGAFPFAKPAVVTPHPQPSDRNDHGIGHVDDEPDPQRPLLARWGHKHDCDAEQEQDRSGQGVARVSGPGRPDAPGVDHEPQTRSSALTQVQREPAIVDERRELKLGPRSFQRPVLTEAAVLRDGHDDTGDCDEGSDPLHHDHAHRPTGARHER